MNVASILKSKGSTTITIGVADPVSKAVSLMVANRIGAILALDDRGEIAGIFSERDLVHALNTQRELCLDAPVGNYMTRHVVTCTPRDPVAAIMGMMTAQRFRHVPVVEDGKLVGIVSIGDVVKSRIEEAEAEADALRRYISM